MDGEGLSNWSNEGGVMKMCGGWSCWLNRWQRFVVLVKRGWGEMAVEQE